MFLSPEKAISIQNNLGSDTLMSFDGMSLSFTNLMTMLRNQSNVPAVGLSVWRLIVVRMTKGLFGIVQGAGFEDLRRQSAHDLVSMDFQVTL